VLLALSTTNKIGLAGFAALFVVFALLAALVIPRWRPDFPGEKGRGWFIVVTLGLFVAMLFAVEVFAKEEETEHEATPTTETTPTETAPTETAPTETAPTQTAPTETAPPAAGDPAAGEEAFTSQGCGGCHALAEAGTNGAVGPNLDESLQGKDAEYVRQAIVEPNAEVAEGYAPNVMPQNYGEQLSDKQIDDLVALLTES
jgi:mono/diheme cytochrome c family protein